MLEFNIQGGSDERTKRACRQEVRERFKPHLKAGGFHHRAVLCAWAYVRGKPYSFVEPRFKCPMGAGWMVRILWEVVGVLGEEAAKDLEPKIYQWIVETAGVCVEEEAPKSKAPAKLYVLVRKDMPPGDILCQSIHAALSFGVGYPGLTAEWHENSNTLCVLAVDGEKDLVEWQEKFKKYGRRYSAFAEPDMRGELTAIAVEPSASKLLRHLPLAMITRG